MKKILLTGGRGLIGQKLGQELVKQGYAVTSVTRRIDALNFDYPCHQVTWDDLISLHDAGFEAVIHLAGESIAESRWTESLKKEIFDSRVLTTQKLREFCEKSKVKTFVSASAIGIYGEAGDVELTEGSPTALGFLPEVCKAWEEAALSGVDKSGLRIVVVRIGIVLAKERVLRQGALGRMKPIFRDGFGAALGSGKQWMSWVHINDVVGAMLWALNSNSAEGVYNCVAPNPQTNLQFSRNLADHFGKALLPSVPKFVLSAMFGEFSQFLLQSQRVLPQKLLIEGYQFRFPDLKEALVDVIPNLESFEEELVYEQFIPKPRAEVFKFFEEANNLESITPPWLNFKVLNMSTSELEKGTILNYNLSLHGISFGWQTLIEDWKKNDFFIDTQLRGPYKKWHHTHEFSDLADGTLMRDIVRLKVPVGGLGYFSSRWKVLSDVSKIFQYRREWAAKNLV